MDISKSDSSRQTRLRILKAAAAAFASNGFRASTMSSIAYSAKVNEVTVYRYFSQKQQLYWEALDYKLQDSKLVTQVMEAMRGNAGPKDFLYRVAIKAIDVLSQDPSLARLLYFTALELDSEKRTLQRLYLKPLIQILRTRIDSWIAEGEIRKVNSEAVAVVIVGVILCYCNFNDLFGVSPNHELTARQLATECAEICISGLCPA